jgi:hypothetical protein
VGGAKPGRHAPPGAAFHDRMADIAGREADRLEIGRLERQQGQQVIVPARHPPGAAAAPRPDHRRDVMNERNRLAALAQPLGDAPAEARTVDRDHGVRPHRPDRGHCFAHPAQDQRRPGQHLGHPRDREIAERDAAFEPLRRHRFAADPVDAQSSGGALAQRCDQGPAQRIARRLARNDEEERRRLVLHWRGASFEMRSIGVLLRMTSIWIWH